MVPHAITAAVQTLRSQTARLCFRDNNTSWCTENQVKYPKNHSGLMTVQATVQGGISTACRTLRPALCKECLALYCSVRCLLER